MEKKGNMEEKAANAEKSKGAKMEKKGKAIEEAGDKNNRSVQDTAGRKMKKKGHAVEKEGRRVATPRSRWRSPVTRRRKWASRPIRTPPRPTPTRRTRLAPCAPLHRHPRKSKASARDYLPQQSTVRGLQFPGRCCRQPGIRACARGNCFCVN